MRCRRQSWKCGCEPGWQANMKQYCSKTTAGRLGMRCFVVKPIISICGSFSFVPNIVDRAAVGLPLNGYALIIGGTCRESVWTCLSETQSDTPSGEASDFTTIV